MEFSSGEIIIAYKNGVIFLSEPSFGGLLKDLAIFFGTILVFVIGFLAVGYVVPPSRNPYGFWLWFLVYLFGFTNILGRFLRRRSKKRESSSDRR